MEWLLTNGVPGWIWVLWPVLLAGAIVCAGIASLFGVGRKDQ